jgi:DNA-directed RNA polymerase specialized sigma24 family protein
VLWLRIVRQLSFFEIAKQLGLSLSAVKNLAYRAKLTLSET